MYNLVSDLQKQESSCSGSQGVCAKCQGSCGDSGSGVIRVRGMTPASQRLSSISLLYLFLQFCILYNNMQSRTDQRSKVISIIRVFNLLRHFSSTHTHRSLFFHFFPFVVASRKLKNVNHRLRSTSVVIVHSKQLTVFVSLPILFFFLFMASRKSAVVRL